MARPGTRRYNVDLLYNMRLYDTTIKNIKEGRQKIDKVTVTALEQFSAMPAKEKNRRSFGQYEQSTKIITQKIRQTKDPIEKAELKKLQRQGQLKAVYGKDMLTKNQYTETGNFMKNMGFSKEEIREFWGY